MIIGIKPGYIQYITLIFQPATSERVINILSPHPSSRNVSLGDNEAGKANEKGMKYVFSIWIPKAR